MNNERIHICRLKYTHEYCAILPCGLGATIDTCINVDKVHFVLNDDFIETKLFKIAFKSESLMRFTEFLIRFRDKYRSFYVNIGEDKCLEYQAHDRGGTNKYIGLDDSKEMRDVVNISGVDFCDLLNKMNKFSIEFK